MPELLQHRTRRAAILQLGVLTPSSSENLLAKTGEKAEKEEVRQSQEDAEAICQTDFEDDGAKENRLSLPWN